jgi:microcystin-dependent protein
MATPFIGEIKLVSFNFPPKGWAFCNGQLLAINQNQALFSILGTTYGGDGRTNFALPNLQGRVAIHPGNGNVLGQVGGETAHVLIQGEMPTHAHTLQASLSPANSPSPTGNVLADVRGSTGIEQYQGHPDAAMSQAAVAPTGGSQPHDNMQPYTVMNFAIALVGLFPSRNAPAGPAGSPR